MNDSTNSKVNKERRLGNLASYDPRTKLYLVVLLTLIMAVGWKWQVMIIGVAMSLVIVAITEVDFMKVLTMSIRAFIVSLIISIIVAIFVSIKVGVFLLIKLLLLTLIASFVAQTMKQSDVLDALAKGFGMNAQTAKRLSAVLTFVPHLEREKKRVKMAQRARGVDPDEGSFISKLRKDFMLAIPNYKCTFIKTGRQMKAMEMRQYTSVKRRKCVHELKFTWVDEVILLIFIIALAASILLMLVLK
ncbi:MAG: energy-coupling factor transporter transmembrane protein EcfT [Eubacterium sp.]|nr:energy-coupling factor transporter transmembrane protein EcfT [Eubacterium sp.]